MGVVVYMKVFHTVVLVLLAFAAGVLCSQASVSRFTKDIERELRMRPAQDRIYIALRALQELRESAEVVDYLESELDVAVLDLADIVVERPKTRWKDGELRMIRYARECRTKFPRESGVPDVTNRVNEAFLLLNE
jgi:hypothetical protein